MAAHPETLVPLSPEMSRLVQELVDSGRFSSAADAVHGALLLLRDDGPFNAAEVEELRADVAAGLAQLDAGQGRPWDPGGDQSAAARRRSDRAAEWRLMARVIVSPEADADIDDAALYVAQGGIDAALRFVDRLDSKLQLLAWMPNLGPARPELAPGPPPVREVPHHLPPGDRRH